MQGLVSGVVLVAVFAGVAVAAGYGALRLHRAGGHAGNRR